MTNTAALTDVLDKTSLPHDVCLAKVDVSDFYMDGDHSEYIRFCTNAADCANEAQRRVFEDVVTFILYHHWNGFVFRVVRGSGMGAASSSRISSVTFNSRVEMPLLRIPPIGLYLWVRYEDDIFAGISREAAMDRSFRHRLDELAAPQWKLDHELVQPREINMLDITISKPRVFAGFLEYAPYFKPTLRNVPLHHTSCHAPGIQRWPITQVARIRRNSKTNKQFQEARSVLLERFSRFFLDPYIVQAVKAWRPTAPAERSFRSNARKTVRLVLDFHPALSRGGLSRTLAQTVQRWSAHLEAAWPNFPVI